MVKKVCKCKDFRKVRGKNRCKNFLGYKTIQIDDGTSGKGDYTKEIFESCVYRCALREDAR
ncbi:hypothetical protein [Intestinibacter sp.]|uniref:hypothetical protein n=1 Tax=Intestinibacter sp. TaxID=1965304 RepID=UPI002A75D5A9|nr:hypothetical protein [Intestinibacter sp.]MDY2736602.1 hypothetical protein [Intestinibacter sp.]